MFLLVITILATVANLRSLDNPIGQFQIYFHKKTVVYWLKKSILNQLYYDFKQHLQQDPNFIS